ncbi:hypothetical protein Dimus_002374 [Dionaea muscipula]
MEMRQKGRSGATKRRRSKSKASSDTTHRLPSDPSAAVAATLAVLSIPRCPSSEPLLKSTLNKLLRVLLSAPPLSEDFLNLTISVLPPLLSNSRSSEIISVGARIVGAASLISFEMNEKLASDGEIVRALVPKVVNSETRVAMAACDAILDLSTTSLGRKRLLELSALEYLMLGFLQVKVYKSSGASVSVLILDKGGVPCVGGESGEDELLLLLLNAAVTLVNSCSIEHLEEIPKKLMELFVVQLKQLWTEVRAKVIAREASQRRHRFLSNLTASNVAESLFRLSMNATRSVYIPTEEIVAQIFGTSDHSFMDFLLNHWESSVFLLRKPKSNSDEEGDIFRPFMQFLNCSGEFPSTLSALLQGMVSCVPIGADDTDILNFLKEAGETLGCPMVYEQDIRVLRTWTPCLKTEDHYFERSLTNRPVKTHHSIYMNDIMKCEDAYKLGYTIAMRGMEFRCMSIAAIADKLAYLFGQPSVGANLYLTPPNSQGLACHYDDHCVFVCQLRGTKQWTVFHEPVVQLPRLYQHMEHSTGSLTKSKQITLTEGDVLYIPRGVLHEASTSVFRDSPDRAADFSLHITLSVEIERSFEATTVVILKVVVYIFFLGQGYDELPVAHGAHGLGENVPGIADSMWEGFAHVALFCWSQSLKASDTTNKMEAICVSFLHVAIGVLGNSNPVYRKACLVAADSLTSDTKNWLDQNQRAIFNQLIGEIYEVSSFMDALKRIQMSIQSGEDPFHWIRWLSLLIDKKMIQHDWLSHFEGIVNLLPLNDERKDEAEAAFLTIKSKFCREVVFDDVKAHFKMLHGMYKKTRKQYMNGMLSLHF